MCYAFSTVNEQSNEVVAESSGTRIRSGDAFNGSMGADVRNSNDAVECGKHVAKRLAGLPSNQGDYSGRLTFSIDEDTPTQDDVLICDGKCEKFFFWKL